MTSNWKIVWNGDLSFTINPAKATAFNFLVRIPGWAQNEAIPSDLYQFKNISDKKVLIKINGKAVTYTIDKGYAVLKKQWEKGDKVEVSLPMEVRRVVANKAVTDDNDKVALQRWPIIYCAEWVDKDKRTSNIIIPAEANFTTTYQPELLNGITVLKTPVFLFFVSMKIFLRR